MVSEVGQRSIINSALWAAYGDALGFISELTDDSGLTRRLKGKPFERTSTWRRLIGGKFNGVFIDLPAGCYSDDTQLRLSTGRCIRADGSFDVEIFAKIELPIWLSYSLGAGVGTKSAATSLASKNSAWFSNFFNASKSSYMNGGGNGAAMRIQPHVWAAASKASPNYYLKDVVRNSICTHGHPRGFLGAALHAMLLAYVLQFKEIPNTDAAKKIILNLGLIADVIGSDREMATFWLPTWEKMHGATLASAIRVVQDELLSDLNIISDHINAEEDGKYEKIAYSIGALDDKHRGSGTKTVLLSLALSWLFRNDRPEAALLESARLINSDTDTVSTLAGAMLGAIFPDPPSAALLDKDYIASEAMRFHLIASGNQTKSFVYPDLLEWQSPRNALDCVGLIDGKTFLSGLGELRFFDSENRSKGNDGIIWRWAKLDYGQTILCKCREELRNIPPNSRPASMKHKQAAVLSEANLNSASFRSEEKNMDLFSKGRIEEFEEAKIKKPPIRNIDDLSNEAIRSGFDPRVIGQHLLDIAEHPSEIEIGIAYVAIVLKARKSRLKFDKGR